MLSSRLLLWGCKAKGDAAAGSASARLASASASAGAALCPDADPKQCFERAQDFDFGSDGARMDREAAIGLYRAACARGVADACNKLADLHYVGEGSVKQDKEAAKAFAEKACSGGNAQGCMSLGHIAKTPGSYDRAITLLTTSCQGGNVMSCASLAGIYDSDLPGRARDQEKAKAAYAAALKLAEENCGRGNAEACNVAGAYHEEGRVTRADAAKATALYEKACSARYLFGCTNLGLVHENGLGGLPKNLAKAISNYEGACQGGDARGCYLAGRAYDTAGPSQDKAKAATMFQAACDRRHAGGCNDVGVMHANGEGGLAQDKPKALSLYSRACDLGNTLGCENLSKIMGRLEGDKQAAAFRQALKVGDDSHCGLVIEVKPPIAKIQTMLGEMWLKIEQLHAKGKQNCSFRNGVYVDPD